MVSYELGGAEASEFHKLAGVIRGYRLKNLELSLYADAKKQIDKTMHSIPASMMDLALVVGWPEKAIAAPARWIRPLGFRQVGGGTLASELNDVMERPGVRMLQKMAIRSSLRHGCAFMFVTKGDTAAGEPEVIYSAKSALEATGRLNMRTLRLDSALEVVEAKKWVLYLGKRALTVESQRGSLMVTHETVLPGDSVPCSPYTWDPTLEKPFGRSRITPTVKGLTTQAVRIMLRAEVHGEAFAFPRRVLIGAREEAFLDKDGNFRDPLTLLLTGVWGIPDYWDEEAGEWRRAQLEQLSQGSMEPHIAHLRAVASQFAAETSIPMTQVGLHTDNPASAESTRMQGAPLEEITSDQIPNYQDAQMRTGLFTAQILDPKSKTLNEGMKDVRAAFARPGTQTTGMVVDQFTKIAAVMPWIAETDTGIELTGLEEHQVEQLKASRDRMQAKSITRELIESMRAERAPAPGSPTAPVEGS